jgi:hypothetical protein
VPVRLLQVALPTTIVLHLLVEGNITRMDRRVIAFALFITFAMLFDAYHELIKIV